MNDILVTQHNNSGCMSACIAMVAKIANLPVPHETVIKEFHEAHQNGEAHPRDYLSEKLGLESNLITNYDPLYPDQLYILLVPSLNSVGLLHAIVMYDGEVFDPSREGQLYTMEPMEPGYTQLMTWGMGFQIKLPE